MEIEKITKKIEAPTTNKAEKKSQISDDLMLEYLKDYHKFKPALIKAAAISRDHAVSYRQIPFKVGCALMAKEPGLEAEDYVVYNAYNFKPQPAITEGKKKRCAERNAIEGAINKKCELIIAIVVVSKEISTGDDTRAQRALHPCKDCRNLFRELKDKNILRGDSMICCVNNENTADENFAEEEMTVDQLLELYKDDEKNENV